MKNYITQLPTLHVPEDSRDEEQRDPDEAPDTESAAREIKARLFVLAQVAISAFLLVKIAALLLRWFLG